MKAHGAGRFGEMVDKNIAQARYLESLVEASPVLELLATGPLSVVNFRYKGRGRASARGLNGLNRRLVGAIPSLYSIHGKASVRVCNLNQRCRRGDFEALVAACETIGAELERERSSLRAEPCG
jgi:glutamate/tyrosine decarboxylase-like PLP-dependent enzyme